MSLIKIDLSGLSEPGVKLIEKMSDAIGAIYKPTGIRREAKAQADADKTKLISKLQLEGIERRAVDRLLKKEVQRQENLENITIKAAVNLQPGEEVKEIDQDWLTTFINESEDISDADLQSLWAKILSEEAKNQGSYNKRTLKFLSSLSKHEAETISYFGKFVWLTHTLTPILYTTEEDLENKFGINFETLSLLDSLGVIQLGMGYLLTFGGKNGVIHYYGRQVKFKFKSDEKKEWSLDTGQAILTPLGVQLIKLCGSTPDMEYLETVLSEIRKNAKIESAEIIN